MHTHTHNFMLYMGMSILDCVIEGINFSMKHILN